jgi:hypothetical protein
VTMIDEKCVNCLRDKKVTFCRYFDKVYLLPELRIIKHCICKENENILQNNQNQSREKESVLA